MPRATLVMTMVVSSALCASVMSAQPPPQPVTQRPPAPEGRRLIAADGDVVVLNDDDRVRIVRRREAQVRVVEDQPSGTILVMVHWTTGAARSAEGIADWVWRFGQIESGEWPFGSPWDGPAIVEETDNALMSRPNARMTLETSQGHVHFLRAGRFSEPPQDGAGTPIHYWEVGGSIGGISFDDLQRREINTIRQQASLPANSTRPWTLHPPTTVITGSATASTSTPLAAPPSASRLPSFTGIRKVHHVDPVLPEELRRAGVVGVSIVELKIDDDGVVTAVRILRSIPGTDEVVIAAVKQWRYEMGRIPSGVLRPVTISVGVTVR